MDAARKKSVKQVLARIACSRYDECSYFTATMIGF